MKVPKLLRNAALFASLIAAAVPSLSVPANAAWRGWLGRLAWWLGWLAWRLGVGRRESRACRRCARRNSADRSILRLRLWSVLRI